MSATAPQRQPEKQRRNVSLDADLNAWLSSSDVENASGLIQDLLRAYKAYGDAEQAIRYVEEKQKRSN